MKFSILILGLVLLSSCQQNDSAEVKRLSKSLDSLQSIIKSEKVQNTNQQQIPEPPRSVYAFCVIYYNYIYHDGPTFDGKPPVERISKEYSTTEIQVIENNEDSKFKFRDQCESAWRNYNPNFGMGTRKLTDIKIYTFPSYSLASQERQKYLTQ
jgi:hypothetical protein